MRTEWKDAATAVQAARPTRPYNDHTYRYRKHTGTLQLVAKRKIYGEREFLHN
jgi:hypothetical protein